MAQGRGRTGELVELEERSDALERGRRSCTGFRADFGWIDLPIFDEGGEPAYDRGVVEKAPGLYFVGRFFQYALSSALIGGVGRDAEYVAKLIAKRRG